MIVRVARRAVQLVVIPDGGLRDHDRTRRAQALHHRRVLLGAPVPIGRAPARARKALNVDPVLHRHRHTVQRTEGDVSTRHAGVRRARLHQDTLVVGPSNPADCSPRLVQPTEVMGDNFGRGDVAATDPFRDRTRAVSRRQCVPAPPHHLRILSPRTIARKTRLHPDWLPRRRRHQPC